MKFERKENVLIIYISEREEEEKSKKRKMLKAKVLKRIKRI